MTEGNRPSLQSTLLSAPPSRNTGGRHRADRCPGCGGSMEKAVMARDFVIYLCHRCRRTFYNDSSHSRHIPLAVPYEAYEERPR